MLFSHLWYYFIAFNYAKRARKVLAAFHIGNCNITEYIDTFQKHLVYCTDVFQSEANFLFNMAAWLVEYVLPYNYFTLSKTMPSDVKIGGI